MHEELLHELEWAADHRNFFRFGILEDQLFAEYGKGHTFAIPNCPTASEFVACLPEDIRERFVRAKKKLCPNYKVTMPGGSGGVEG